MKVHYNSQHSGNSNNTSSNNTSQKSNSTSSSSNKNSTGKYFDGAKKGEIHELQLLLKNTINEKDEKKKREIFKKVIAYMTLGIDVSRLFNEMCMHSYTNDIVQKKMIYLYLTNYAEQNPDSVVLAINTFRKDCGHKDPKIRGLALRSLCSLRFSGSFDYLLPAIQDALKDFDPYVRKVAVLGCLKVFYVSPETIKNDFDILDTLYKMIRDTDPLVITNAISALQEILDTEFQVSTKMIIYLLNRLKEFPEFSQALILQLASTYKPKSEQETFDILNLLDERLKHSSISIVLSTIKVFLNFTSENIKIQESIYQRIKAPLLTLLSSCEMSGQFEIAYIVLKHIHFLVSKGAAIHFQDEYKYFYVKADETSYIKLVKLQILSYLANENNIGDLLNELGEYVTDVDHEMARNSIKTLGFIAIRINEMAVPIVKQLSTFVSMKREYITNQTLIVFKDILRKHPEYYHELGEVLQQAIDYVTEPDSKIALFWILGEFGQHLDQSAYILENFVFTEENQEVLEVKHALLSSCIKLFLKKAPEMQTTLGGLFKLILGNEQEDLDLRDRAAFYYRAMKNNINEFKTLILSENESVIDFAEDDEEQKNKDSLSFNTLSITYNKSSDKYLKSYQYFTNQRNKEAAEDLEIINKQQNSEVDKEVQDPEETQQNNSQQQEVQELDILDMDIPSTQSNQNQGQSWGAPTIKGIILDDLVENYVYDADDYETQWENLDDGATLTRMLNSDIEVTEEQLEELFKYYRIYSVATGEEDGSLKLYMYSYHQQKNLNLFVEAEFNLQQKTVSVITKSQDEELAVFYSKYIEELMKYSNLLNQ